MMIRKIGNGFPLEEGSSIDLVDSDKDGKLEIISRMKKFSVVSMKLINHSFQSSFEFLAKFSLGLILNQIH